MAENLHDINDDLLVKHLTGEATVEEAAEVDSWLLQSGANRRYYNGFIQVWEQSLQLASGLQADESTAWQQLKHRMDGVRQPTAPVRKIPAYKTFTRIAVAIVLVIACGVGGYYVTGLFTKQPVTLVALKANNDVVTDTLADGSLVTINKHSGVIVPSAFKGKTREVKLTGEAFFNIAPDKNKPFIIHADGVTITVVGTSFNVRTAKGKTEVIVETGVVKVSNGKQTIKLLPKEKVTADTLIIGEKDTTADKLYNYYRSREFVCNNTPLKRLVEILNEAYDSHISIENSTIENLPITTVFKEEPIEHIMAVITETLGITAVKNGDGYILR